MYILSIEMMHRVCLCWINVWIDVTIVYANYVLSNENVAWQDAKSKINFATPLFQIERSSFSINITPYLKETEEAWVGYYQKEEAFAYIGCVRVNDEHQQLTLPILMISPGLCFSMCDKSSQNYIGINRGKCYCMNKIPSEMVYLPKCDIMSNGTWIVGGDDEYMSIYERMNEDENILRSQSNRNCTVFRRNNASDACKFDYTDICENGGRIFIGSQRTSHFEWDRYHRTCRITNNDTKISSVLKASNWFWSNVRNSDVIYQYSESSDSTGGVVKYGYITKRGNNTFLSFTENSRSRKRYLLSVPAKTTKRTNDNILRNNDSGVIIAVSVPVAVIVIVVAAVIVIITFQTRCKIPSVRQNGSTLQEISVRIANVNHTFCASQCTTTREYTGELHRSQIEPSQDPQQDNMQNQRAYCSLKSATLESHKYDSIE